jgi:hypothetical protein
MNESNSLKNNSIKCPCRIKKCKRFGKCDLCIKHHQNHKRYPLPYCMRKGGNKNNLKTTTF